MQPLAPWGLGTLRLHESSDPAGLVHAALDAGCRLLDLADVYGDGSVGHAESIVADALAAWSGDAETVRLVTKGGLQRKGRGRWDTNGKGKHLRAAAEGSLQRLGRIDLYLLHARDPRTKFATSLRALRKLLDEGLVGAVGLCNVRVCDIEEARAIVDVRAVQIALSPWDREPVDGGVVRYCQQHGIEVLAHSPFGGFRSHGRTARNEALTAAAQAHGATPYSVAVQWLGSLGVTALVGSTRPETLPSTVPLTPDDLSRIDSASPAGALRGPLRPAPSPDSDGEVVLLMGIPGAGKSTMVQDYLDRGYGRLNRDERGGRLDDLLEPLDEGLAAGQRRWVLDNTYPSRAARQRVVNVAWDHGVPTRCVWLTTSQYDAQRNAVARMLGRHGRLLDPAQMSASKHPADFAPNAQLGWLRKLEEPVSGEGHAVIERRPFVRREHGGDGLALAFDYRLLWGGKPVPGVEPALVPGAAHALARWAQTHALWPLAFLAEKDWPDDAADALLAATHALANMELSPRRCRHPSGPPVCWCRKPMPGLVVAAMCEAGIPASQVTIVQTSVSDRQLAQRLGCATMSPERFLTGR